MYQLHFFVVDMYLVASVAQIFVKHRVWYRTVLYCNVLRSFLMHCSVLLCFVNVEILFLIVRNDIARQYPVLVRILLHCLEQCLVV